jgi:hypothetical protein
MKTDSEIEELKASILPEIPSSDRNSIALSGKSYLKMNSLHITNDFKNNSRSLIGMFGSFSITGMVA